MVVDLGELYSRNAAVALRAQGDGARGVRDVRVSLPIPDGAVGLYLLLDNDAPCWRLLSAALAGCRRMSQQADDLWPIFFFPAAADCAFATFVPGKGLLS